MIRPGSCRWAAWVGLALWSGLVAGCGGNQGGEVAPAIDRGITAEDQAGLDPLLGPLAQAYDLTAEVARSEIDGFFRDVREAGFEEVSAVELAQGALDAAQKIKKPNSDINKFKEEYLIRRRNRDKPMSHDQAIADIVAKKAI